MFGFARVWLLVAFSVAGSVALVFAVLLWSLAHLDHPWIKPKVEHLLSHLVGVDVRYEALSLSPTSGLSVEGLALATPDALRAHAPEMVRFERASVALELRPLLSGRVVISEIRGGAVEMTLVLTDDGRSSLGELGVKGPLTIEEPEAGSTPLSESLAVLQDLSLKVGSVRLAPIRIHVIEVVESVASRRTDLDALALESEGVSFDVEPTGFLSLYPHKRDVVAVTVRELGANGSEQPAEPRKAHVAPRIQARLEDGERVVLKASASLRDQSLFGELRPVESLFRLTSSASFEPARAQTTVKIDELDLLDSMLVATVEAVLEDQGSVRLSARGQVAASTLPWALSWLEVEDVAGRFDIRDVDIHPEGVTAGSATLDGTLHRVRYAEGSLSVSMDDVSCSGALSAPSTGSKTLGSLALDASGKALDVEEQGRFKARIDELSTVVALRGFGAYDPGMWGLKGTGSLDVSMGSVKVQARDRMKALRATAKLDIDLEAHRIAGRIPVRSASFKRRGRNAISVRRARVDVVARHPLDWMTSSGTPAIGIDAAASRVSVGKKRFRAPAWSVQARRAGAHQYAFDAWLTADQVSWGRFQEEPESSLSLEATFDAKQSAIDASAMLSIAGKAATSLSLQAAYDAPTVRYSFDLQGSEAGPLVGALLFKDGGRRSDELSFAFESSGELAGLVSKDRSGALVVSTRPLRTARGTQRSALTVQRLALVRHGVVHSLQDFDVEVESKHEAPGKGSVVLSASLGEGRYGEPGRTVAVRQYAHRLQLAYAALYGAPSFAIESEASIAEVDQPFVRQYPIRDVEVGAEVEVDDTRVVAVRQAYLRNPAGGTRFEARGAYEGWTGATRDTEVCDPGTPGCPEVVSMYGREAAAVMGTFEQDFQYWKGTNRMKSSGSFVMPFILESGDLSTYRLKATAQFRDVMLELPQYGLLIEDLDAMIPVDQEIATTPRMFIVPTKSANMMTQKRFFDLYPFTETDSFFTVDRMQLGREVVGPVAANLQIVGSALAMDQLHAGYRSGIITGQVLADLNREDPKVVFRGNVTGVEPAKGRGVLDANLAMTFVPTTLILEGKGQVVRVSKDHLYEILDVLDPYREDEEMNRVRRALKLGYPKSVLLKLDEGLMNAKVDLGGLARAVRIDEIKGIPVTPFMEKYVQPYLERFLSPSATRATVGQAEGM